MTDHLIVGVLDTALVGSVTWLIVYVLRQRDSQRFGEAVASAAVQANRKARFRYDAGRPADFGPLTPLTWDRVNQIRKAIYKAQFVPPDDDAEVCINFDARRCWLPNASNTFQRDGAVDVAAGPARLRRWLEEPDADERWDHWLEQWDDNPLVALTGRGDHVSERGLAA